MAAQIIDGKALALTLRESIGQEVAILEKSTGVKPGLAAVLVGDDPASAVYVRNKKRACEKAGLYPQEHILPASTTQGGVAETDSFVECRSQDPWYFSSVATTSTYLKAKIFYRQFLLKKMRMDFIQ